MVGWTTIATDEPNDGKYVWNTSLVSCPGIYWMNLSVYDTGGQTVFDEANNSFNLFCPGDSPPIVAAYGPGGLEGETFLQGDFIEVTWFAVDDNSLPPDPINISFGNPTSGWTQVVTSEQNDGHYSWNTSGVPCPGPYWINISVHDSIGQIAYDNGNYSFNFTCPVTNGSLNGTVMDSNGDPISDVTILLLNSTGAVTNITSTNATGGFSFTDVYPGTYNLSIGKEGYRNCSKGPVVVLSGSFVDSGIIGLETNATINGRVTDETGKPIQSAIVKLIDSNFVVIRNATTDVDGNFSFRELGYGTYRMSTSAEGFVTETTDSFTIDRFQLKLTYPDIALTEVYTPPEEEQQYDWTPIILVIFLVIVLILLILLYLMELRRQKAIGKTKEPEDETTSELPEEEFEEEESEIEPLEDIELDDFED
jgi:hypothetical protein